jgi:hypothetical protein
VPESATQVITTLYILPRSIITQIIRRKETLKRQHKTTEHNLEPIALATGIGNNALRDPTGPYEYLMQVVSVTACFGDTEIARYKTP